MGLQQLSMTLRARNEAMGGDSDGRRSDGTVRDATQADIRKLMTV